MKNVLVICGPTASGKTSLALSIAKQLISRHPERAKRAEGSPSTVIPAKAGIHPINSTVNILSADSRQIYQGLDIVTGKDIPSNIPSEIKIYGLNLISPNESFNVADYSTYAHRVIRSSIKNKIPLIIVGGTGLYLKAVTQNLLDVHIPPNPPLRNKLEKLSLIELQEKLSKINPEKFNSLNNSDRNNPRRLIRAIEISKSFSSFHNVILSDRRESKDLTPPLISHFTWIGIKIDKEDLVSKIRLRVIDRINSGAIEEVKTLLKRYPDKNLPIYSSLGVKEIISFLDNKITRKELIELWKRKEMDYARRQVVWFKKQPGIVWYDKDKTNSDLINKFAHKLTQNDKTQADNL